MDTYAAVLLDIVQGLTEFLPVSSSGHLVLIQSLWPSFSQPGILLEVVLHGGTLLAVVVYFRKRLKVFLKIEFLWLLFMATLPAVVVGLLFRSQVEALFQSVKAVGLALIVTGLLNLLIDKVRVKNQKLKAKKAFITGIAQAVAIIPGISRSGSTIFASVAQGINKQEAVEFSFLLSVPAVLGANLLEILSVRDFNLLKTQVYLSGFMAAFIFGYLAIGLVFKLITTKSFKYFAYYCFILGVASLILAGRGIGQ